MKVRGRRGWAIPCQLALGLLLTLLSSRALAQIGQFTTQSLFFNQAGNAHRGNYIEADAGVVYNDNVFLRPTDTQGDTLVMIGLLADTEHQSPRLDYRLDSDISLVKYLQGDFKTQPFGYLDGFAEYWFVPGFFSWTVRDTYNQLAISQYAPLTPDNLESINFFTTGPRFRLKPTLRTTVQIDGVYSQVNSSSNSPLYVNIDNTRYGGVITVSQAFSSILNGYVSGAYDDVKFKNTTENTDFKSAAAMAGFKFEDARTILDIAGGYQKLRTTSIVTEESVIGEVQRTQEETPSGVTWQGNLSRLIRPTQRLSLHALRQISDAANLFRLNFDQPVGSTVGNQIVTGAPFRYTSYGATYRFQYDRTSFQVDLLDASTHYQNTSSINNGSQKVVSALFARQLSPTLNWDIGTAYTRGYYGGLSEASNMVIALTSLHWKLGARVRLRFVYAYGETSPHGYTNNQIGVFGYYALTAPTPGTARPEGTPTLEPVAPMSAPPTLR
jgi:hypothetical protein